MAGSPQRGMKKGLRRSGTVASGRGFGLCVRCKTLGQPTRFRLDRLFVCLDGGGAETGRQSRFCAVREGAERWRQESAELRNCVDWNDLRNSGLLFRIPHVCSTLS